MHKRINTPAVFAAAAFYVVIALSPVFVTDFAVAKKRTPDAKRESGSSDMLPVSPTIPLIKQASDVTELSALVGNFQFILFKAAMLLLVLLLLHDSAHYKQRALKIQTARWCAS